MRIRRGRNGARLVHVNGRNLVGHDLVEEELVWAPFTRATISIQNNQPKYTGKDNIFLEIPAKVKY
jgi:hypothetical protein